MANRNKAAGTRHESWLVKQLRAAGHVAKRLPEGGSLDEGDVEADLFGVPVVLEAKARQTLNVQATLGHARAKASGRIVIVAWRRLVPVEGKRVRQPVAGERVVASLSLADLLDLLAQAHAAGVAASACGESSYGPDCPVTEAGDTGAEGQAA